MDTYRTWATLFEQLRYYSWIVDRFHISTIVHQNRARGIEYDLTWLEHRLVALGFRLILCVREDDSFESAPQKRLAVSGNPAQYDDLSLFVAEQEAMRAAARCSILPTLELNVSDGNVERASEPRITLIPPGRKVSLPAFARWMARRRSAGDARDCSRLSIECSVGQTRSNFAGGDVVFEPFPGFGTHRAIGGEL